MDNNYSNKHNSVTKYTNFLKEIWYSDKPKIYDVIIQTIKIIIFIVFISVLYFFLFHWSLLLNLSREINNSTLWSFLSISSGLILLILLYFRPSVNGGVSGIFLGASGDNKDFNKKRDIGNDKIKRYLLIIFVFIFIFVTFIHNYI